MDRVNPQDIDYGQRIEDVRQTAIMATIDDYYFWSNLAATGALSMMFLIVWWQHRQNQRMRHSTARIVTGYYNELAVARDQITRLSTEYTQAKRMLAEQLAANLAPKALLARQESAPGSSGNQGVGGSVSNGQPGRDQLQAENEGLKQQVRILTLKCQEEQQRNRKLKGE
jgi:hypothetical protein